MALGSYYHGGELGELDRLAAAARRDHAGELAADIAALRVRLGDCLVIELSREDREAISYARSEPGQWSDGDEESLQGCKEWIAGMIEGAAEDMAGGEE